MFMVVWVEVSCLVLMVVRVCSVWRLVCLGLLVVVVLIVGRVVVGFCVVVMVSDRCLVERLFVLVVVMVLVLVLVLLSCFWVRCN